MMRALKFSSSRVRMMQSLILLITFALIQTTANAQNWSQLGIDIDGEAADDGSGHSVSLSADGLTLAIGAPNNSGNGFRDGHVRVYKLISGVWTQHGVDIDGEAASDWSGYSVSLSANGLTLAIGAILNSGNGLYAGHVRVYQDSSGTWIQQGADIDGEDAGDNSGASVSLSADGLTLAIGAPGNDENGTTAGHVRVYKLISEVWTQQGADIDGEAAQDINRSGRSISLSADGSILAIGAPGNDGNGTDAGHVRVYKLISGVWTQLGADIDGEAAGDQSGFSVSLSADGLTLAIGAYNNEDAGHVRVYEFISGVWTQHGVDIDGEAAGDNSGWAVSLNADGLTLAIGATSNDGIGSIAGHVRVYKLISGVWTQHAEDINGEADYDYSGFSTSLSADGLTLAIGAAQNDGNGEQAGHVRVYKDTTNVVGIIENNFGPGLTVYPNPTDGHITIDLGHPYSNLIVEVRDITSKQVATFNFSTAVQTTFEIEGAKGLYLICITAAEGKMARLKVMKN